MSDFDLLVRGELDLGIAEGKFVAIGENLAGRAREEIDASGLRVLPGVIDAHVHFNEPGRTDWEGFATGSSAAAAGGTTLFFDMPLNTHPPTVDGPSFDIKRAAAEARSVIDFGLWGGLVPGNVDHFETLRDRGAVGLKAFMSDSGIDDFACVDEATLRTGMRRAAELGMLVAVHAESDEITRSLTREKIAQGRLTARDYLTSRPVRAELDAITRAIDIAGETAGRLHVVHVSSGRGVRLIAEARARGVDVSCETCPHYLVLEEGDFEQLGAVAKCAPPLRSAAEREDLWAQLRDVTTIGSDHSPSPWAMKESADFFAVWGGISGCQHLLPLLLDAAEKRSLSWPQLVEKTSARVAERFRIRTKGSIAIGMDADLTLADPRAEMTITAEGLHYRHRHSPYVGRTLRAQIVRTICRGQTVFHDGKVLRRAAAPQLIRPEPA